MKSINQFKKSLVLISLLTISFNETLLPQASVSQPHRNIYNSLIKFDQDKTVNTTLSTNVVAPILTIPFYKNPNFWVFTGLGAGLAALVTFYIFAYRYPTIKDETELLSATYNVPDNADAAQFSQDIQLIKNVGTFVYSTLQNKYGYNKHCFLNSSFSAQVPERFDRLWCGKPKNQSTQLTLNNLSALLQKINQDPQLKANIKEITLHSHGLPYIKHKNRTTKIVWYSGFMRKITKTFDSNMGVDNPCAAIKIKCTNKDLCKNLLANSNLPI